ncbi:MAG: 4,5-DOPA dioxygenase extradiol [Leptospirales bacterium]|nr:4,5-DOPA dioxygenase extradiol [Leptospirales bacterium]
MTEESEFIPRAPALFVGHGSPINAIADNEITRCWSALGEELRSSGRIQAVLCISAHWMMPASVLCNVAQPETIYDFYGFPEELYALKYPAPGEPQLARRVAQHLANQNFAAGLSDSWGLDHGAWSVLRWLFPDASLPVFQLALDRNLSHDRCLELGALLRPFRDLGVLILGSGNVVHNLRAADFSDTQGPLAWNLSFDAYISERAAAGDIAALAGATSSRAEGRLAHPSDEHFRPLLYVAGASDSSDRLSFPVQGFQNASISMRSLLYTSD